MQPSNKGIVRCAIILSVGTLCSLLLMNEATLNSQRFGNLYVPLLLVNAGSLFCLLVLIVFNIHHLVRRVKAGAAGARLTMRMVAMTAVLVIVPVGLVYYFSLGLLRQGIDSWFDLKVEQALEDSLELSRLAIDVRTRELLWESRNLATDIAGLTAETAPLEMDALRERSGASELTLINSQGKILAASSADPSNLLPRRFEDSMWLRLKTENSHIAIEDTETGGLVTRIAVNVPDNDINTGGRVLQLLFPTPERINELAGNIQGAFTDYQRLSFIRTQLKDSFVMTLTVVLLFALFSGIWAVFFMAGRLVSPLRDLAHGTRLVSAGDYHTRLPLPRGNDELSFLVASFNEMTQKIGSAREDAEQNRRRAEAQHAYLQTVLEHISSGVLVFDSEAQLRVFNACAGQMLEEPLSDADIGCSLAELAARNQRIRTLEQSLQPHLGKREGEWQEQLNWFSADGKRIIRCGGAHLDEGSALHPGHVIVLEDITALLQSQRDAAWREVARRLAHEIKNPLTPIQLSAERLRHKYLGKNGEDNTMLDRMTNTIIGQVQTMQGMVDSFTEYASPPALHLEPTDLNALILETLDLYQGLNGGTEFQTRLEQLPLVRVDACRIRQVLNNLISNSIDVCHDSKIDVSSKLQNRQDGPCVCIDIRDAGPGLSIAVQDRLFEPYVTTKTRGTGLGLAIARRIVEDHGGIVRLANNHPPPGANAHIELPVHPAALPIDPARLPASV